MTRHQPPRTNVHTLGVAVQPDLFGGIHPTDPPSRRDPRTEAARSNDADLLHTVAANATRVGYVLVGSSERVYARTDSGTAGRSVDVVRVPRYEEDAVHQLLWQRSLTLGAVHHNLTCGAATLTGTAVLVPRHTRAAVARWEHRNQPPRSSERQR